MVWTMDIDEKLNEFRKKKKEILEIPRINGWKSGDAIPLKLYPHHDKTVHTQKRRFTQIYTVLDRF